jgi:hypothetical protein
MRNVSINFLLKYRSDYGCMASEPKICKCCSVKLELTSVTKVSVDILLVDSKTTTFRDVSTECGEDPHISM